ncbi:MAG: YIP1 family protein [Ignavibacteriales bacterium]|nr:MAG: YIP1 family protein [Ignavibacteriales bacterium]
MNEFDTANPEQNIPEEQELSHTDKMVGVFTEPAAIYTSTAKFPLRTIDWLLPFIILLALVAISQVIVTSNPEIAYQIKQKQMEQIEKNFADAVEKGQMTQEQADQQMERIQEQMESFGGGIGKVIQVVSIFIVGFIFFFIVSGIWFLLSKFALKGDGTYVSALVASGLTAYISMIQVLVTTILAIVMGRLVSDTSVASLMNIDKTNITGFLLSKLDVFSIWAYAVLGIGLAKLFKSESTGKYIIMVFAVWLIWSLIVFVISKAVPFLSFLGGY